MSPKAVKHLGDLFQQHDYQVRVVGGWVRDTLMGIEPKDLDLCTTAFPSQMIAMCQKHGLRYLTSGIKHGTIGIIFDEVLYEVTTLRVDVETDGRHAIVEFTDDWRADAARRDFTINAMSMDKDGKLYDYFGGVRHLAEGKVVFVGDPETRIQEDYLRILRYYRFLGRLERPFLEDVETERLIYRNITGLEQISVERIWMEMAKILSGGHLDLVLWSMFVAHVFDHIGIIHPAGGDIVRAVEVRRATDNPLTVLAALTGEDMAERWKLSRPEASLLRWLQQTRNARPPYMAELKDIATTRSLGPAYAIEWAALFGPHDNLDQIRDWPVPVFPVSGADLVALGMPAGPDMGRAMHRLEMIWKSSNFSFTKDQLLGYLHVED